MIDDGADARGRGYTIGHQQRQHHLYYAGGIDRATDDRVSMINDDENRADHERIFQPPHYNRSSAGDVQPIPNHGVITLREGSLRPDGAFVGPSESD